MANLPLDIPPGFVRTKSPNAAKGRYVEGDKVRFINKLPEKWLGWTKFVADQLLGVPRGMTSWTNQYGNINVGIGTHLKLYALTGDDTVTDITPIRSSVTINTNPFATVSGSTTVTVTDTAHGAIAGDYVTFSGATAVGGITISGEYAIVTEIDNKNYTIVHSSAATSTASGGGASVTAAYQINIGTSGTVYGLGWGAGNWSEGTWGTERTEGISLEGRYWSTIEYGNDLLASPSLGGLYLWQEATDARAEIVTNAPTSMRAMFVTGERYVFALGTTTGMTVAWPDVDDITDWTPSAANTANTRTLQSGGKLINGCPLTGGTNLVWSDTSLYVFQKVESDFVYDSRLVGNNCGLIAPGAFTRVSGVAFWMSAQNCHLFTGNVQAVPRFEEISNYVFDDMDPAQIAKIWAYYDQKNNQVRWSYCSLGSTEPDKYFDVSLDDWSWTTGTWDPEGDRTTGALHRPAEGSTLLLTSDGYIYAHDDGLDADGSALNSYYKSGLASLANGQTWADILDVIPDFERQTGNISFRVFSTDRPDDEDYLDDITVTISKYEGREEMRLAGRHIGFEVRSNVLGGDYRGGVPAISIQEAGERV